MSRGLSKLFAVLVALAFTAPAAAHPAYRWCHHHRCTRPHRAYNVRCGGWDWLSPRPVNVPAAAVNSRFWRGWCLVNIPAFRALVAAQA